ncbi:hypothetical protein B4U79_00597, partial [Dinothrombium tinctorium]
MVLFAPLAAKILKPCFGTLTKANIYTLWILMTLSMRSASHLIVTGYVW